ncbi:uncharacterized protein LOC127103323 [Lathyrus oleraceus]|uniref:uncharacterized protein LOC127103323 n=1 Tax=Pisum sativum TaxID=3888 RepID=UPI0021D3D140|nr:uncharacterized protein LOC127103323 [Pisum sativum]
MFTSEEWLNLSASKEVKGKKAIDIVLQVSFWEDIVYILKAMGPLVKVLRLVFNEKKSAMGNIYHVMLEANIIDTVDRRWSIQLHPSLHAAEYYLNSRLSASVDVVCAIHGELSKYKMGVCHFALMEAVRQMDHVAAAKWWRRNRTKTPNLQLLAIKILSLTYSSLGYERNWSAFEHCNQNLKERFDNNNLIDPVVMDDDIDTNNLWLLGGEGEAQLDNDDMVFDGDDLSWLDVEIASGVAEPTINTRSQTTLQKKAIAPPPPSPSSSRSNPKTKEVVVVDDEFGDQKYFGEDEEGASVREVMMKT